MLTIECYGKVVVAADQDFPDEMNWDDAMLACKQLGSGWRLPTTGELEVMYNQFYKNGLGDLKASFYWSCEPHSTWDTDGRIPIEEAVEAFFFDFCNYGTKYNDRKYEEFRVRAVCDDSGFTDQLEWALTPNHMRNELPPYYRELPPYSRTAK